jgi:hypothetical protein
VREQTNLRYLRDAGEAVDQVRRGEADVAFLTNPVSMEQLREVAFAGDVMPQNPPTFSPSCSAAWPSMRWSMTCPAVAVEIAPDRSSDVQGSASLDNSDYQARVADALAAALVEWRSETREGHQP